MKEPTGGFQAQRLKDNHWITPGSNLQLHSLNPDVDLASDQERRPPTERMKSRKPRLANQKGGQAQ
eukprot:711266-Lingulodinium_polyedra.AAC.1